MRYAFKAVQYRRYEAEMEIEAESFEEAQALSLNVDIPPGRWHCTDNGEVGEEIDWLINAETGAMSQGNY